MNITEKNIFLANFCLEAHFVANHKGKDHYWLLPRDGRWYWAYSLKFCENWQWFQLAFQKFRHDFRTDPDVQLCIEIAFTTNDIEMAVDVLIEAIKEYTR